MIFSFFYQFFLGLYLLISLPRYFKKGCQSLFKRFYLPKTVDIPKNKPIIWIHAVSVGETKAISGIAHLLKESYPNIYLILSSITETGYDEAKRSIPFADQHFFLPYDFTFLMKPLLCNIRPTLVILSETDYWWNFLRWAKNYQALTFVLSAKISEKSTKRLKFFRWFSKRLFHNIDHFYIQDENAFKNFLKLGIKSQKLTITGNLKFDPSLYRPKAPSEIKILKQKFLLNDKDLILTIASTHDNEEAMLLQKLEPVLHAFPNLKLFLAPRHPERISAIKQLLKSLNLPFTLYSETSIDPKKIILIDKMGKLNACFQCSTLSIVGGSFRPNIGGHNILEPVFFGVPVIFGPYTSAQKEMVSLVKQFSAGIETNYDHIELLIRNLLMIDQDFSTLKQGCLALIKHSNTYLNNTFSKLVPYLEKSNDLLARKGL